MKNLYKLLTPFAPDASGAVSVLYEMGGLTVILDAGGCTGNVCGFDEPRWLQPDYGKRSAIFSAGLRDMDAIFGRDKELVAKLTAACEAIHASFIAIVGTPVPSVIGTDFHALRRMTEKATGLPVLSIETSGLEYYDRGIQKANHALFSEFATDFKREVETEKVVLPFGTDVKTEKQGSAVGILGMTPLDFPLSDEALMRQEMRVEGYDKVYIYGLGDGLSAVKNAGNVEKNLVVSVGGLPIAKELRQKFGTPYEARIPERLLLANDSIFGGLDGKRILVVDEQVRASCLRKTLLRKNPKADVICASFFCMEKELLMKGDVKLKGEEDFAALVRVGNFDVIFADETLAGLCREFRGKWVDRIHFALSGRLE